jgi:Rieske Fe-S protein
MSDTHLLMSRRQFCGGACQVASISTLATLLTACSGGSSSPSSPSSGGGAASLLGVSSGAFSGTTVRVTVAGSALTDVGGAVLVQSIAGVFLLSRTSATAFTAVDAVCTHEGCTITGTDGDIFVCPCHGSRYNRSGQVVFGPATASLRKYSASLADGVVTITL